MFKIYIITAILFLHLTKYRMRELICIYIVFESPYIYTHIDIESKLSNFAFPDFLVQFKHQLFSTDMCYMPLVSLNADFFLCSLGICYFVRSSESSLILSRLSYHIYYT